SVSYGIFQTMERYSNFQIICVIGYYFCWMIATEPLTLLAMILPFPWLQSKKKSNNNNVNIQHIQYQLQQLPPLPIHAKISVIIPTFNEEKYIRRTIEHALDDEYVEIIICDGGSTDHTKALL